MARTKKETVVEEAKVEAPAEKKAAKKAVKEAKKAEKATKKAAEKAPKKAKPTVTEAHAKSLNVRVTPRKARLVVDLVRGRSVKEALDLLANLNRAASEPVAKLIKSAAANATNNFGMNEDKLVITYIAANDGIRMRRYLPRAKGSASGLVKRTCNLYVTVAESK